LDGIVRNTPIVKLLSATIVVLFVAVCLPGSTFWVLSAPAKIKQKQEQSERRNRSLNEWQEIKDRAKSGDADAMYRLGTKMRFAWTNEEMTGVRRDSIGGVALIRKSAEKGNLGAQLTVWNMNGQELDELLEITDRVIAEKTEFNRMTGLLGWLQWNGLQSCDQRIVERTRQMTNLVSPIHTDTANRQAYFEEEFKAGCTLPSN